MGPKTRRRLSLDRIEFASEQGGAFEHSAEVLFAGELMCSSAALEALKGFVTHFQTFQMNDADKFFAAFPGLPLPQFHVYTVVFTNAGSQRQPLEC